jgi:hypothetical protein
VAVTAGVYNTGLYNIGAGNIHWLSDTFKVALMPSTYTPDIDADEYYDDISASECPSTGNYSAGGATVAGKTLTNDTANDKAVADADNPSWANLTQADIRIAVLYKETGDPATAVLLMYWDFGVTQSPAAELFELPIPTTGVYTIAKKV